MNNERIRKCSEALKQIISEQEKGSFFREAAGLALDLIDILGRVESGEIREMPLSKLRELNDKVYAPELVENYAKSYCNPAFAAAQLGLEKGRLCSAVFDSLVFNIRRAFRGEDEIIAEYAELLTALYEFEKQSADYTAVAKYYHDFKCRTVEFIRQSTVNARYLPENCYYAKSMAECDPCDLKQLFYYGIRISDIEIMMAEFLNGLSDREIDAMAQTFVGGYVRGFEAYRIDLSVKKYVEIMYPAGLERMAARAVKKFAAQGLTATLVPESISENRQSIFDHRFDEGLFLDEEFVAAEYEAAKRIYDRYSTQIRQQGGPAVIEYFGEPDFEPVRKSEAVELSADQRSLSIRETSRLAELFKQYLPGEERSFTIIAYPLPTIGEKFADIFKATVKVNTLDSMTYRTIQQKLIDALDGGDYVRVLGMNGNRTDITVQLHELPDPSKQTNFENCIDDVNIPVGEVFTSPLLTGTNGVLHVSEVFLAGMKYTNLFFELKDGMVSDYGCDNFADPEEGRKLISEDILNNHETVPLGEFAIGTNTTAYVMGIKYGIQAKLPILIAEKTGPHFAFGDTCYSWSEDHVVYNPDGKEIYARDNEITLKYRKTDPEKAYFDCHTDVTLPYNELGEITVYGKNGYQVTLIKNGRFVLPGTEELNKALDEL